MHYLLKDAIALSLADVAARIKKANAETEDAGKRGEELVPREFTESFAKSRRLKVSYL